MNFVGDIMLAGNDTATSKDRCDGEQPAEHVFLRKCTGLFLK